MNGLKRFARTAWLLLLPVLHRSPSWHRSRWGASDMALVGQISGPDGLLGPLWLQGRRCSVKGCSRFLSGNVVHGMVQTDLRWGE